MSATARKHILLPCSSLLGSSIGALADLVHIANPWVQLLLVPHLVLAVDGRHKHLVFRPQHPPVVLPRAAMSLPSFPPLL